MGACRRDVRIAVVREDGVPAAFFPHQRTAAGVGRAVGLGLSDCQGLVHRPGFTGDATELLRGSGLALWEFDHLAADQPLLAGRAVTRFGSPVMDVAGGWDDYLAGLRERSPKFTRTTLAKERRLTRDYGPLRYVHDERDPEVLRRLMAWKSAQYRRTGRGDRFAKPWVTRLVEHLFHTAPGPVRGLLSVLYAGQRPVAAHFGLRSRRYWPAGSPRTTRRTRSTPPDSCCTWRWRGARHRTGWRCSTSGGGARSTRTP
ncbi:hypothetical protein Sgou_44810 [Streptomyces gougerotii]|uniref:BioF2-like acetyltransferase domain-containing protein n=1 Tax=Streptomyces gougerotii TaxID=53448 RepID=A0ABQ1DBG9_9ACTN|nr:GNAT family N-acetyltransferase [Streptomyces gougerotii]GFH79811.1 hypothetical protein Sgou_44810 [Streptomyces gougerotii]